MADEVQSYNWAQMHVTIHPVMAFVNVADEISATPTYTEAIFCITDDPKHDAAAVSRFMNITNTYLKEKYQIQSEVLSPIAVLHNTEARTALQIFPS